MLLICGVRVSVQSPSPTISILLAKHEAVMKTRLEISHLRSTHPRPGPCRSTVAVPREPLSWLPAGGMSRVSRRGGAPELHRHRELLALRPRAEPREGGPAVRTVLRCRLREDAADRPAGHHASIRGRIPEAANRWRGGALDVARAAPDGLRRRHARQVPPRLLGDAHREDQRGARSGPLCPPPSRPPRSAIPP